MTFEEIMSRSDVGHVMIFAIFVLYGFCDEHRTTMIREVLVDK